MNKIQKRLTQTKGSARRKQPVEVCDLVAVQKELERTARRILAFTDSDIPDFIRDAVIDAIEVVGHRTRFPTPTYDEDRESRDETVKILADLFSQTRRLSLRPNTHAGLAELISAVMKHPLTPERLHDAIGREVTEMSNSIDEDAPDSITRVLEAYAAEQESEVSR